MARFIGYLQGQAGEVSRLGSPRSGIAATANGWNVGVHVSGQDMAGDDVFHVRMTGGSNGGAPSKHLGTIRLVDGVPVFTVSDKFIVNMDNGSPVVSV